MGSLRRRALELLIVAVLMAPGAAHAAFECPVKAPPATKPLPDDLGKLLKPYDDPRVDPTLKAAITKLKAEGMPNGEILDHVVAAYCPTVAAIPGLSDHDDDDLVRRFASDLAQAVYAPTHDAVDDIILDVPVPPDLYAKVKEAADQHKMSQDAFVVQALRTATRTP